MLRGSSKSDIFALGMTILELMLGSKPYERHIFGGAKGRPPRWVKNAQGQLTREFDADCVEVPFIVQWSQYPSHTRYSEHLRNMIDRMIAFV